MRPVAVRGRILGLLCAFIVGLGMSGCGFQLRGQDTWPAEWREYRLMFPARDPAVASFIDLLDEALSRRGLRPAVDSNTAFTIHLRELRDSKTVAAIGGDGKAVEFEVRRQIDVQLIGNDWRSEVFNLSSQRRLSFDPSIVLAKEAEEARLRQGLARDLIELLLMRTEAELKTRLDR